MTKVAGYTEFRDPRAEATDVLSPETGILVIYTGGTIGAVPSDRKDRRSPLNIATWSEFNADVRELDILRETGFASTRSRSIVRWILRISSPSIGGSL